MTDQEIKAQVYEIKKKISAEAARHEKRVKKLRQELWAIQKECPHNKTSYEPDPSGNNDSTMTCLVCDKEARRL